MKADRATLRALLECDSMGSVLIKQIEGYELGERIKPPKISIENNLLTAVAAVDSQAIYLTWKERHTTNESSTVVTLPPVEVNRLSGLQWFLVWCGILAIAYGLVRIGYGYLKRKLGL